MYPLLFCVKAIFVTQTGSMKIQMFQADAFTDRLFGGNPAAICILDSWLPEYVMQAIAAENNLAETAFIVKAAHGYDIRWFTPAIEVDLCGHATLAAAHIVFSSLGYEGSEVSFSSERSGMLKVKKDGEMLTLDFPADVFEKVHSPAIHSEALGIEPMETYKGRTDYMAVLPSEADVVALRPDFVKLNELQDCRGIIVTAAGTSVDFVSRFFAPQSGINEDPVTGSAHTTLTPYWANVLCKNDLTAMQLSQRKGQLWCSRNGNRVYISGHAVTYMQGAIEII